jgi:hypothetical protein
VAKSAVLEVEVTLTVRAQVEAEGATPEELRRFVEREQEAVIGTVARASLGRRFREVGWLDESRAVFVTEVTDAEPMRDTSRPAGDQVRVVR